VVDVDEAHIESVETAEDHRVDRLTCDLQVLGRVSVVGQVDERPTVRDDQRMTEPVRFTLAVARWQQQRSRQSTSHQHRLHVTPGRPQCRPVSFVS